jgi:hypothetical protein
MITWVRLAADWYQALWGGIKIVGKGLVALGAKGISYVTDKWSEFFDAAAQVAEFLELDLADSFASARDGLAGLSDGAEKISGEMFEGILDDSAGIRDNLVGMTESLMDAPDVADALDEKIAAVQARIKKMREGLDEARAAGPTEAPGADAGAGQPTITDPRELAGEEDKLAKLKEQREQERIRNEMAERKLTIMREEDELRRAQLEFELGLFELEQQDLTAAEKRLETTRLTMELQRTRADIRRQELEDIKKARDLALKRRADELKAIEEQKKAQREALKQSIELGNRLGDVLVSAFEKAGVSARAISFIRGAQYAADAIGQAATFNFIGAGEAAIASAQHFAIAGGAGGGGGGGGGASGGSTPRPDIARDPEARQERLAELFADKLQAQQRGQEITIVNDFGSSTHLRSSHETAEEITTAVRSTLENQGIILEPV